jgi:hypothetical protein
VVFGADAVGAHHRHEPRLPGGGRRFAVQRHVGQRDRCRRDVGAVGIDQSQRDRHNAVTFIGDVAVEQHTAYPTEYGTAVARPDLAGAGIRRRARDDDGLFRPSRKCGHLHRRQFWAAR